MVAGAAADLTLAVGLSARETTSDGPVGTTLAGGTLGAGRLGRMLVAVGAVSGVTSDAGVVGTGASDGATRSSVEPVTAAALLAVEATAVVVVETTAIAGAATGETAFVAGADATVETAFVVSAAVDLAIATVDATGPGTDAPAAPHDCAGDDAAAITTPTAIDPANDLELMGLMAPPGRRVPGRGWLTPNQSSYS